MLGALLAVEMLGASLAMGKLVALLGEGNRRGNFQLVGRMVEERA
jgi:hypothetical protein